MREHSTAKHSKFTKYAEPLTSVELFLIYVRKGRAGIVQSDVCYFTKILCLFLLSFMPVQVRSQSFQVSGIIAETSGLTSALYSYHKELWKETKKEIFCAEDNVLGYSPHL